MDRRGVAKALWSCLTTRVVKLCVVIGADLTGVPAVIRLLLELATIVCLVGRVLVTLACTVMAPFM